MTVRPRATNLRQGPIFFLPWREAAEGKIGKSGGKNRRDFSSATNGKFSANFRMEKIREICSKDTFFFVKLRKKKPKL